MNGEKLSSLVIQTPEGCRFSLLLAGPITRFLAWLIDLFVVIAAVFTLQKVFGALVPLAGDVMVAALMVAFFLIWFGYGIVLEWFWHGRTIGKKLFGLRVTDEQGLHLTFYQVALRNLLRLVDMLPMLYLAGGLACLLSRRCQRLGDLAAGTVVIRAPRIDRPDLTSLADERINSFRDYPHLEARLRQRISPAEARVALRSLLRRDELDPAARVALFEDIAGHFRAVQEFPPGATDGLSDEQYVRNVVESLFRPQKRTRPAAAASSGL